MKHRTTITVTYEDHGTPIDDWAYRLRMGGVDVDDEDVQVKAPKGRATTRVHYQQPVSMRYACGRLAEKHIVTSRVHADIDCGSCLRAINQFPAIFPDR